MKAIASVVAVFLGFAAASASARAQVAPETLLLQEPDIAGDRVVFVYAKDLWIASATGGEAKRLTSSTGDESNPRFSPDGQWIAFTGQYAGNPDVYVIPASGGDPKRLTWHPSGDTVQDWTRDGSAVVFTSARTSGGRQPPKLYTVPVSGGPATAYKIPRVVNAQLSLDGTRVAYMPTAEAFRSWKRYRGGRLTRVWVFDIASNDVKEVPHVNASDAWPCWVGDDLYFASDRDNHMNVWKLAKGKDAVEQVTTFTDFDVRNMGSDGTRLVFEQAGALHVIDSPGSAPRRLQIRALGDFPDALARWTSVSDAIRDAGIAPNGKRVVFEARGEILTVPREYGDARNLSDSPGAHDRSPAWSPDGAKIAWFSDSDGEYKLLVRDQAGKGEPQAFDVAAADRTTDRGGFYANLSWSPDGKHLLFCDKTNRVAYLTLESGKVTDVARIQGSLGEIRPGATWSADSKWIAFEQRNPRTTYDRIALYELATGKVTSITDAFGSASSPAFSRDGKHLYFSASVESGPQRFGLDMSTSAARDSESALYVVVLQKDGKNPFAPKSDEGFGKDDDKDDDGDKDKKDKPDHGDKPADRKDKAEIAQDPATPPAAAVADASKPQDEKKDEAKKDKELPALDLEGIDQRILALPLPSSRYGSLAASKGQFLFVEFARGDGSKLKRFDFDKKKAEDVADGVSGVIVSADGKSLLTSGSSGWQLMSETGGDKKSVKTDGLRVRIDPSAEWAQTLREVWRLQRDYFYDPNMHGVDWPAMWERWSPFVAHAKHRADLNMIIAELIGELCCGHQYVSGGEMPDAPDGVGVGLLGADFTIDSGRHRIARIYRGQNWNPGQRAPLTEPGVDAREGDYLIRVNGAEVRGTDELYRAFENTAGKQVELVLSANADGSDARTMTVVPIANEGQLRQLSWIEANRRRVEERSGGKLGYIYMPNTGGQGMASFDRDFYSQLDKQGLVIDERFNGGGQVADYVIGVLSSPVYSYWLNREGWLAQSPFFSFDGPKVMVTNEYAGSGGDWMPWTFQRRKVGKLVGMRTWGGLVGISGYPPLMDGGSVTAASFGVMDVDGSWAVENVGVAPDLEVVEWPKRIIEEGADPQLDEAIRVALEDLEKHTPAKRPVYTPPSKR
jgi:tricorn protease